MIKSSLKPAILPHVVSSALAMTLTAENRKFTSTGFRDTTRIAAGDPSIWIDILLSNSEAVVTSIDKYTQSLHHLRDAIKNHDENLLRQLLEDGKQEPRCIKFSRSTIAFA